MHLSFCTRTRQYAGKIGQHAFTVPEQDVVIAATIANITHHGRLHRTRRINRGPEHTRMKDPHLGTR